MKKYCLLENGDIEPCYYLDQKGNQTDELRHIYKEGRKWYLMHDKYAHNMILTFNHEIIAFADTIEELQAIKK